MLAAILLLLAQDPPPPEEPAPPKVTLAGRLGGAYVHREGTIEEARGNLNTAAAPSPDTDFFTGRASVRLDADFRAGIRAVVEIENQPYSAGGNNPFGRDRAEAFIEQAYVELRDFLAPRLTVRAGVQDLKLTLRPHADAFFLDLSESESFYSGATFGATSSFVRPTADRDLGETAGLKLIYDAEEFLLFHAYAGVVREGGAPSEDENLFYLYGNLWIPETVSVFLLAALVSGPAHESQVATIGLGADGYLKPWLEAFGEFYLQAGSLDGTTRKGGWAGQLGTRAWMERWFVEGAFAYRSGDDDPLDGSDGAFQSYESVNQFLVVESAEFGLDWDTNVRSLRFSAGLQSADLGGRFRDVTVRLDAGLFRFNEALRSATATVLVASSDDAIGNEIDLSIAWLYEETVTFTLRAGALLGSDVLERLTAGGDTSAFVVVAGMALRF